MLLDDYFRATRLIARGRPTRLNSEEIGNPTEKQVLGPKASQTIANAVSQLGHRIRWILLS
jgi:hypothetical protein